MTRGPARFRDVASRRFEGSPKGAYAARRFAADVVRESALAVADDAVACAAELASNAVLHTRSGFEVVIRHDAANVRVEVVDSRPLELPFALPSDGVAHTIIDAAQTGRGLRVVAALAPRWGVEVDRSEKRVWAELGPDVARSADNPVVTRAAEPAPLGPDAFLLQLRSLPVRAAVASGLQTDGLVREMQLGLFDGSIDHDQRAGLYALLDQSGPARLSGRQAALRASAAGQTRFDADVALTAELVDAFGALGRLLKRIPAEQPLASSRPSPQVIAFRAWLDDELSRQLGGDSPRKCDLPD